VDEINSLLKTGISPYQIEKQFADLHRDAVYRHRQGGHISAGTVSISAQAVKERKAKTLVERIEQQVDRVERVARAGEKANATRTVLDATREMRGLLELLGKASGELRDGPQVSVNLISSPDWIGLRAAIFEVLMAYPEARAALSTRLLQLEGGQ
jgi:hypothetical protein